jgi:addiction module RelE/StbE family toxin
VTVVWTRQAKRDLEAIYEFIAHDSHYYATEVVDSILEMELQIAAHPTSGNMIRERMRKDIRQVRRYSYRVIYRIYSRRVDVLTVVHEKRHLVLED